MVVDLHWPPTHWPDGGAGVGGVHWPQNHWPTAPDGATPTSPGGAGAFELALEGAKVTYSWLTAVEKHYDGTERRASLLADPSVRFEGEALLVGDPTRAARTRLARFAALGLPFLLGLPFEALAIRADSTNFDVAVWSAYLARADWAVAGVRVIVQHREYGAIQAVIQDVSADTITVLQDDGSPIGNAGKLGGFIMPAASVFLFAQQALERYQPTEPVERWQIRARNADRGFSGSPVAASLVLDGIFAGLTISARTPGELGNAITISYFSGSLDPAGVLIDTPNHVEYQYQLDVTTIAAFIAAFQSSTNVRIDGSVPDDSVVITGITPIVSDTPLTGGINATSIEVGIGATITTFAGRPVWDRVIAMNGTVSDSIQSMTDPQDLGGLPYTAQTAKVPDWGRAVAIDSPLDGEWQWAKRMLWTIRGRWKSFFLPTWRRDLKATASGVGTLTVTDGEDAGDARTWYPAHRQHLQILKADRTIVYARIAAAASNSDGTTTLSIVDGADAPITLGATPSVVSWLEECHLESDDVPIDFRARSFSFAVQARVVQSPVAAVVETFIGDEASTDSSEPREGVEIILPAITYRIATGTRDEDFSGEPYLAQPAQRGAVNVITSDDRDELELHMPAAHPFVATYMAGGVPPRLVLVNVRRKQLRSGEERVFWRGHITSVALAAQTAIFKVPSRPMSMLGRRLPTITVGRACPHILYDANCQIDRDLFKIETTAALVDGRKITVASIGGKPDQWALGGELLHVPSGERMTIADQVGAVITVQLPIGALVTNDAVVVFAGCDHTTETCRDKFDNVVRFGGHPSLPKKNPFFQNGLGIYQSEDE